MTQFLDALADVARPPETWSRWVCDRPECDGEPHGDHWRWCSHPCDGRYDAKSGACSLGCGRGARVHHEPACRHARAKQRPPEGDWTTWLLLTGRGFGKSRTAAEWLVESAWNAPAAEWCAIARSASDVRKNARDMTGGLEVIAQRDGRLRQYNRHEEDVILNNGAVIHCLSADKPDKLRGYNLAGAWADEICAWRYAEETWNQGLGFALRIGAHARVVVTTTPKPTALIRQLVERAATDPAMRLTTGSTFDNAANLSMGVIEGLRDSFQGTRLARQEIEGELVFDTEGALVSWEMIEDARLTAEEAEERSGGYSRIVVAVDPAGSYGERSDETGIVVCAKGRDSEGYVLADYSCKKSPRDWALTAVRAFERFGADRIVAEKNQGHLMVEEVIRSVAPRVPYTPIQASLGKRLRAEPVTALYEQGRIHHAGSFPVLEEQLTTWDPDSKQSPDRLDAMVHGMTELGLARFGAGEAWLAAMKESLSDEKPKGHAGFLVGAPTAPAPCSSHRYFGPEKRCAVCGEAA